MSLSTSTSVLCAVVGCFLVAACAPGASQNQAALNADSQLQLAEAADTGGNVDAALSMYQAAASRAPSDVSAQLRYADALARYGKIAQAQRFLLQQLNANPGQRELARASALVDIIAGNASDAIPKLDRLLATDPRDENALTDKGVALDLLGRHADAQELYHQALAVAPNDVAVTNDMAVSMMLEGRQQEALRLLESIDAADGAPTRVRVNLGILYAANSDVARAREVVKNQIDEGQLMALARSIHQASLSGNTSR